MNKQFSLILLLFFILQASLLQAQVTMGLTEAPTRAALLELKTRQEAGVVSSVSDTKNATSTDGGFLLPRVELVSTGTLEPFIATDDPEFVGNTNSLKEKLAGLMVYNIKYLQIGGVDILYPAVYTWNGAQWTTSQANDSPFRITDQPRPFTFYENIALVPIASGEEKLRFGISGRLPDDASVNAFSYQWFMLTGTNVHVRVGTAIGSAIVTRNLVSEINIPSITTPVSIIKGGGDTRNADNNGFYKLYCEATEIATGRKLVSDVAEVAVGCGAKNNLGDWISFMCFNLGAEKSSTIATQKAYSITPTVDAVGLHTYITNEEKLYGDLFQWGRIADGHEKRQSPNINYSSISAADIVNGSLCVSTEVYGRPWQQIKKLTKGDGNFIYGSTVWNPTAQANSDILWRTGRFVQNDPCAHYNVDGTYQAFWNDGTAAAITAVCANSNNGATTNWRTPTQADWGEIYKGGQLSGSRTTATANTWVWNSTNGYGYEIKPNGGANTTTPGITTGTTTLFLPASGLRRSLDGLLYYQGANGFYWSTTVAGVNAYYLSFTSATVTPANSNSYRSYGYALRCIRNQ